MYFIILKIQVHFYFSAVKHLPSRRPEIPVCNPATRLFILVKF
jgi:hypothetical protein